jgi:AcrR family transcriptional regulator
MPRSATSPAKRRGRQRSVAAETAILEAAVELLTKRPLSEVTTEAIARKAGVSKATIYKWWPNKNLVALDAFSARLKADVVMPDTGSAKLDFMRQLKDTIVFYKSPLGRMLRQFLAEGQNDPGFLQLFRESFLKRRRDSLLTLWRRGVERGEIRPEVDGELVLDLIFGPMIYRLMAGHGALDENQATAIIEAVFCGVQTSPARKSATIPAKGQA